MSWGFEFTQVFLEKLNGEPPWRKQAISNVIRQVRALNDPRQMGGKPSFSKAPWAYVLSARTYIAAVIDSENQTVIFTDITR